MIHPDFVSVEEFCPQIIISADYATPVNFTGEVVEGYKAKKAYLARKTAEALSLVQKAALSQGFTLKVFDAYRPTQAVAFFQVWAKRPESNPSVKERFYPKFSRSQLFEKGFIAKKSSHSRGSAVDLTLVDLKTGVEMDMGAEFDYFDEISYTNAKAITENQRANRQFLKTLMENHGFKNFYQEWWHFSLKAEQFPDQYFDFNVE